MYVFLRHRTVEYIVEGAYGGELVEHDPVVELQAVAQQLGEVLALEPRHHGQLVAVTERRRQGVSSGGRLFQPGGRVTRDGERTKEGMLFPC